LWNRFRTRTWRSLGSFKHYSFSIGFDVFGYQKLLIEINLVCSSKLKRVTDPDRMLVDNTIERCLVKGDKTRCPVITVIKDTVEIVVQMITSRHDSRV
jgi:hypothetical protein